MSVAQSQADTKRKVFLFLQGPSSPLFAKIAKRLEVAGHTCLRINFNLGDRIFWGRKVAVEYRGRRADWPAYIARFLSDKGVTDLILLGEERPYHKAATDAAHTLGIRVHVVEMGYLRPDWVTFERDGMSGNSRFPKDPAIIMAAAEKLPEPDWTQRYHQTFLAEASYDLLYNLSNVFFWFLYPHYERHALFHPLAEYAGWVRRLLRSKSRRSEAEIAINFHIAHANEQPYFVYPLQLQTDYQLRAHSDFNGQEDAIETVVASFAKNASERSRLVVKIHPLDNGLINWRSVVQQVAVKYRAEGRISVIDGGNLEQLYTKASGVVTVNSTAALPALRLGKPIKVLGRAIYDIDGLTYQMGLDDFWERAIPPLSELVVSFFRLLADQYQVRGNFYSAAGTDAAAREVACLLCTDVWKGYRQIDNYIEVKPC